MMLLEGYIGRWNKYPKDEIKVRVARPSILSPSKELLNDYKNGIVDWLGYDKRFRIEIINNPLAISKLKEIKELSKTNDVRLMCYEKNPPCHRFILIDMINKLSE